MPRTFFCFCCCSWSGSPTSMMLSINFQSDCHSVFWSHKLVSLYILISFALLVFLCFAKSFLHLRVRDLTCLEIHGLLTLLPFMVLAGIWDSISEYIFFLNLVQSCSTSLVFANSPNSIWNAFSSCFIVGFPMGLVATKPVFWVFDKVRLKPACSATETS